MTCTKMVQNTTAVIGKVRSRRLPMSASLPIRMRLLVAETQSAPLCKKAELPVWRSSSLLGMATARQLIAEMLHY